MFAKGNQMSQKNENMKKKPSPRFGKMAMGVRLFLLSPYQRHEFKL